jgi:hypothetical protein
VVTIPLCRDFPVDATGVIVGSKKSPASLQGQVIAHYVARLFDAPVAWSRQQQMLGFAY